MTVKQQDTQRLAYKISYWAGMSAGIALTLIAAIAVLAWLFYLLAS